MSKLDLSSEAMTVLLQLYQNGPQALEDLESKEGHDELVQKDLGSVNSEYSKAYGLNCQGLDLAVEHNGMLRLRRSVKPIIDAACKAVLSYPGKSSHRCLIEIEDQILMELSEQQPDRIYDVDVTASIGKEFSFTTIVKDTHNEIEYTQVNNMVGEEIAPVAKPNMAVRADLSVTITKIVRDELSDQFLETEFGSIEEAKAHIRKGIEAKLTEALVDYPFTVTVDINEDHLVTVWADVPTVTKVRLRATRRPIQQVPA